MPPLDGIRVLDLTRLLPGAYATQLLADRGAEVIKIEDPRGGDTMRTIGARWFDAVNRGKKSVTLDLRRSAPTFDALLVTADVLVDSFRPSTAKRLRVDPETVRAKHPRLICASLIGFPRDSPKVEQPAHDINYQSLAGLLTAMPGPLVADIGGAMQMTIAILAALVERQRTGVGCAIDVALSDAARQWATFPSTGDFASACYTIYETADGEWLALGALEDKFWRAFCEGLGRPDFVPLQYARDFDEIKAVLRTKSRAEWLRRFEGVDTCLTPVRSAEASRPLEEQTAPALGADTDAIVADLRRRGLL